MIPAVRVRLRKLGRIRLVSILTILSTITAYGLFFFFMNLFDLAYKLVDSLIVITFITSLLTPFLSWYLVGLLFKIDKLEMQMTKLATTDSLTQVYNRGYFYQESNRMLLEQSALIRAFTNNLSTEPFLQDYEKSAILVLDLDNLKKINDQFGHAGGDKVLAAFGSVLIDLIHKPNLVGRLGGDEFAVFLKQTDAIELQSVVDQILEKIRAYDVDMEGEMYKFTVSIGVAFIDTNDTEALDDAIKMADAALYDVKRLDRNGYAMHGAVNVSTVDDKRMAS